MLPKVKGKNENKVEQAYCPLKKMRNGVLGYEWNSCRASSGTELRIRN